MRAKRKSIAATLEQRKAMTCKGLNNNPDWTNEDWALAHLPTIRMAILLLKEDDNALQKKMLEIVKSGHAPELLEQLANNQGPP